MAARHALVLLALAAAVAPVAAAGHPDPMWPEPPTLTADEARRIDRLAERAIAEFSRRGSGSWGGLADRLIAVGQCRRTVQLIRSSPPLPPRMSSYVVSAAASRDRDCVEQLLALAATTPAWRVESSTDPHELYMAGALWRRLGHDEQGQLAIRQAERLLEQQHAADPMGAWTCHGGNCINHLWFNRIHALRYYHGSELYRQELNRLAELAISHRQAAEARQPAPYVGDRVFEELFAHAVDEDEIEVAHRLEQFTTYRGAGHAAARMARLIAAGDVAGALDLWPTAGRAFAQRIDRNLVRTHPDQFHRWRSRFREWLDFHDAAGMLSVLPTIWIERGERDRAREALATARADIDAGGGQWGPAEQGRLSAVEAQLDGGGDPIGWLAARDFAGSPLTREYALAELAAGLAAAGRTDEAGRALAAIGEAGIRHRAAVELPCRAAAGGDAAARAAIGLVESALAPLHSSRDASGEFSGTSYQTFLCLFRHRLGEAALAYADAIRDPGQKLALLVEMPLASGVADSKGLRRRFACRAFAHVENHDLWDRSAVAWMAADFERVRDFRAVDRIIARARDGADEVRMRVFEKLLESHAFAAD